MAVQAVVISTRSEMKNADRDVIDTKVNRPTARVVTYKSTSPRLPLSSQQFIENRDGLHFFPLPYYERQALLARFYDCVLPNNG